MAKRKAPVQNPITKNNLELPTIQPKTDNQEKFFDLYSQYAHHFLLGPAGTGKTFLALYKALESLTNNQAYNVTIFRSSVASRDEGFLPGSAEEKLAIFETPYISNVNKIFGRDDAYGILKKIGTINFESIAYQRGNTLDNQIIVIDEAQNCTGHQLDTLITRTGENSRLIICGDLNQQDITKHGEKNVHKAFQVLQSLPSVATTEFTLDDIVRSGLVREYLIAKHLTYPAGY
jgi:phosphate starvation-inducible protein PhoH